MQVLPSVAPDLDPLLPALVGAQQCHLQGLGERRLARPVATHDQGQARPWIDRQGGGRPDATKPLDLDRREVHGRGRLRWRTGTTAPRRGLELTTQRTVDGTRTAERGEGGADLAVA